LLERIINTLDSTIFLWHITESASELAALLLPYNDLALEGVEPELHKKMLHNTQFLSTRILLFRYAGLKFPIIKNQYGEPLSNGVHVSISHSHDYAAIIISKTKRVAIDLEKKDERIIRVAHKFIHKVEEFFSEEERTKYYTLIWSAKETLYKLYTANEVIFKDELRIHPFSYSDKGEIRGEVLKTPQILGVRLFYISFDNYVLTWC